MWQIFHIFVAKFGKNLDFKWQFSTMPDLLISSSTLLKVTRGEPLWVKILSSDIHHLASCPLEAGMTPTVEQRHL